MKKLGLVLIAIALILAVAPFTLYFIPISVNLLVMPLFLLVNTFGWGNYGMIAYSLLVAGVFFSGLRFYRK